MASKRALILGIGGQDGSYIAEVLLKEGYEVHGMYRRSSADNLWRIRRIINAIILHQGDMGDATSIRRVIESSKPDEIYNEADQDSVGFSHSIVGYSMDITAAAVGRLLEMVKQYNSKIKVFQPCTSMMFGDAATITNNQHCPQNEQTPFNPQSPYACAKVAAYYLARHYRNQHNMFVSTAIFYNHDSPRRSEEYLLHKICKAAVRIKAGKQTLLALGNLDARVDIGYALEYMEAAHKIMQLDHPDDFIIGTGVATSVDDIVTEVFSQVGIEREGRITVDPRFYKEGVSNTLRADRSKAAFALDWYPKYKLSDLICLLIDHAEKEVYK